MPVIYEGEDVIICYLDVINDEYNQEEQARIEPDASEIVDPTHNAECHKEVQSTAYTNKNTNRRDTNNLKKEW